MAPRQLRKPVPAEPPRPRTPIPPPANDNRILWRAAGAAFVAIAALGAVAYALVRVFG